MKHGSKAETFFSEEERQRIKETVGGAESRTIGEIAVMVVESSDHYLEAEVFGAVLLSGLLSLTATVSYLHSQVWWYIPISFVLFFPARLLFRRFPALKSGFIGSRRKEQAVRLRALTAFYEKGLYKTKRNTGILFLISVLERKVRVLADSGIHEKIGQDTLDGFAKRVSEGIKNGRACDALCKAIQESGDLLALHFPITPDDINELPDEVLI